MEIELNTGNLRNLCRICLGRGDYNLWEHKVQWSDNETENDSLESDTQDPAAITIHEVLQMYNDWQHSILEFDVELQLICKECLNELQPHYIFYKRLRAANIQIKELYEEALQQEDSKTALILEPVVGEQLQYDDNLAGYLDNESEHQLPDQHVKSEEFTEKIDQIPLQIQSTLKKSEKQKFFKNPKFILTGGVTQLLTHATGATTFDPLVEDIPQQSDTNILYSPHNRKRKVDNVDVHTLLEKKERSNMNLFREHFPNGLDERTTSNYISGQKEEDSHVVLKVEEIVDEIPPSELIECGLGKQYPELIASNHSEQLLASENDAQAAMPFSTVSADDAGRSIYVCKYCPQAFTAPCFLLTHARKQHICQHCSKAFIKTTDLYAHLRESHTDFKCKYCGKQLSSNGNLRAHIKRIHPLTTTDIHPSHIIQSSFMGNSLEENGDGGEDIYIDDTTQHIAEYLD